MKFRFQSLMVAVIGPPLVMPPLVMLALAILAESFAWAEVTTLVKYDYEHLARDRPFPYARR